MIWALYFLVWGTWMILCLIRLERIEEVSRSRLKLVDSVFSRIDWQERLELYKKVSFSEQVNKFWRPVESFYPKELFSEEPVSTPKGVLSPFQMKK